jgi:PKD repeat protein
MRDAKTTWRLVGVTVCWLALLALTGCMLLLPQAIVDFEATPLSGRAPRLVDFTPIVHEEVASYEWDFGDGTTSTEAAPAHIYREEGRFTVSLHVQFVDGGTTEVIKADLIEIDPALPQAPGGGGVYWLDRNAGTIYAGAPDGSTSLTLVTGIYKGQYLAVGSDWVYWTTGHAVKRADLSDGTGRETLYSDSSWNVAGIAVDTNAQRIYWACHPLSTTEYGAIRKANLDGSNQRVWGTLTRWGVNTHVPWLLAVDSVNKRLFWFERYHDVGHIPIFPVTLESGAVAPTDWTPRCSVHWTPVTGFAENVIRESLPGSEGLALDVGLPGVGARYVYWTDPGANEIVRCRPDGSEYRTILADLDGPVALAVNAAYGKLYWSGSEGIHRANLDGTAPELIFPGVQADALALDL